MKETIAELLKVEAEAKAIVARADEEAAETVKKARAEAAALVEAARREAQARAEETVRKAVEEARKQRDLALARIDERNHRLRGVPRERTDAAKDSILSAVLGR